MRCGRCKAIFRVFPTDEADLSDSIHSKPTAFGSSPMGAETVPVGDDTANRLVADFANEAEEAAHDPWGATSNELPPEMEQGADPWLEQHALGRAQAELSSADDHLLKNSIDPAETKLDPNIDQRASAIAPPSVDALPLISGLPTEDWNTNIERSREILPGTAGPKLTTAAEQLGLPPDDDVANTRASGAYPASGLDLDINRPSRMSASLQAIEKGDLDDEETPLLSPPEDLSFLLKAAPPPTNPDAPQEPDAFRHPEQRRPSADWERTHEASSSHELTAVGVKAEVAARWLAAVLVVFFLLVGFLGYMASQNGWVLDFANMDRMFGVAFKDYDYPPIEVQTIRVFELDGEIIEAPTDQPVASRYGALRIENLVQSFYRTRNRVPLTVVEGHILNTGELAHRRIYVLGTLYSGGQAVETVAAPVGAPLSPEDLERVSGAEQLAYEYEQLAEEAAGLLIRGNQRSPFTLVFLTADLAPDEVESMSYEVELVQAEFMDENSAWRRVTFDRATALALDL